MSTIADNRRTRLHETVGGRNVTASSDRGTEDKASRQVIAVATVVRRSSRKEAIFSRWIQAYPARLARIEAEPIFNKAIVVGSRRLPLRGSTMESIPLMGKNGNNNTTVASLKANIETTDR